jgi:hypothetical protein
MVDLLYRGFIAICVAVIFWGIVKVDRIYQYPFFMAGTFIAFILPQINPLLEVPLPSLGQVSYIRMLMMACLCVAMCWVGYSFEPKLHWLRRLHIPLDDKRLTHVAVVFTLIGWLFAQLAGAYIANWQGGGQLSGAGTIYLFFAQLIYVAFAIFFIKFLQRPNTVNLLGTLIAGYPILLTVLGGRRQPTLTFLVILGLSVWLVRRRLPPRWLLLVLTVAGIYLIPLIAYLRGGFWSLVFSGDWQALQIALQTSFGDIQDGEGLELRSAVVLMDWASQNWRFGFGRGLWDAVVFQFVPGQLVGYEFKESLQFNWLDIQRVFGDYDYSIFVGATITGIGDAFTEFWYFGCLVYALIGYLFKHLWTSAVYFRSMVSALLMIGLVSPSMIAVSHGLGRFCQEAVFQIGVVCLIILYARVRSSPPMVAVSQPSPHLISKGNG